MCRRISPGALYPATSRGEASPRHDAPSWRISRREPVDDAGTDEIAIFGSVLPSDYRGGGLTVEIIWAATSAPSGNVVWAAAFERITTIASDSFASDQTTTSAASGTNGNTSTASIAFTNGAQMDSLAAGEAFRLRITRDGDNGSDTMTGDAELVRVVVRET